VRPTSQQAAFPSATPIRSFVAIGDSFTEGISDPGPGGGFRGWADLVAGRLATFDPQLRYANLAVRGKLIGQIATDQVPAALAMGADLATIAGGLNDVMRPGCDIDVVCERLEWCATRLAESAGRLVMFHSIDFTHRMPSTRRLVPKVARLMQVVELIREQHGAIVVDLSVERVFDDRRLWARDRIHLNAEGHRRVAEAVLETLGFPVTFDWRAPLPAAAPPNPVAKTWGDLVWMTTFLAPWIKRRLTGKSSGDHVLAKRPTLEPLAVEALDIGPAGARLPATHDPEPEPLG
jgi:lysophospholipase L1-like esterase